MTDSAVRITHLPTGIVVSCQNERSQHQNKAGRCRCSRRSWPSGSAQEREAELEALSGDQRDVDFGSQIRTYVLQPYQMVKDVRTSYETGNVDAVLDGDLDEFMEAYLRWRRPGEYVADVTRRVVTPGTTRSAWCPGYPRRPRT